MDQNTESKEMLLDFAQRIQRLDEQISELKEFRKNVLAEAKEAGFDKAAINKAIQKIRQEKKEEPAKLTEVEMYCDLLKDIIEPV